MSPQSTFRTLIVTVFNMATKTTPATPRMPTPVAPTTSLTQAGLPTVGTSSTGVGLADESRDGGIQEVLGVLKGPIEVLAYVGWYRGVLFELLQASNGLPKSAADAGS